MNVCKFYLESPLPCASGVTGADLKKRIAAIMTHRIAMRLTPARMLLLGVAAMIAVAGPILVGVVRAQSETEKLTFEVASIRRLDPAAQGGGGPIPLSPGLTPGGGIRSFVSIFRLICWAYRIDGAQLSGGPSWIRSDRYAIEAKPGPDPAARLSQQEREARTRERVKALLAERFHLAVRTETKESEVYVLSVMKGGHKLTPSPEPQGGVSFSGDAIESKSAPISFLLLP